MTADEIDSEISELQFALRDAEDEDPALAAELRKALDDLIAAMAENAALRKQIEEALPF